MNPHLKLVPVIGLAAAFLASSATITVTTVNNQSPPNGTVSLKQALQTVAAGDTIAFNIPGDGPHYIQTPPEGYPLITVNNVTIDGYTQPGSAPNSNGILQPNNAAIRIVLDSRDGSVRVLDYAGDAPNDDTGYGDSESCVLGVLGAQNVTIRGLSILALPATPTASVYGVSFAKGASGRVSGCWIGIDPDGQTLAGPADGITGFRYRRRDENNTVTESILIRDLVVGVPKNSANAPADFNVFCGITAIGAIIEGENLRFSGNFFNVFPDGMRDYNPATDFPGSFEGNIEVGRAGNNTVIGTDGDGVNDADERNVFSGVLPPDQGGYDHNIEFYGQTPGTNIVVAGNLVGVAIDRTTPFANGVPALNAGGGSAQYRFGSNFDGVSDGVEGNVVFNNLPLEQFPAVNYFFLLPNNLNFFDELSTTGTVSARGNVLVNNYPFPVAATRTDGSEDGLWITTYYSRAIPDLSAGVASVTPTLAATTTPSRLVGTVPVADAAMYPKTIIDLYAADPVGIQNVKDAALAELPNGIPQGRAYAASFVDNGPGDRDMAAGAFDFDLTGVAIGGSLLTITANYERADGVVLTSPFSDVVEITFTPGGPEEQGLSYLVRDTPVVVPAGDTLGNWEPYASVLGTTTFLIEANTFAENTTDSQRYVVALQPAAGGAAALGEGFFADNGTPFKGVINASRQNGNPGRVAGDTRPGATRFMVGGEASPHVYPEFASDNRWSLGFARLFDGRYGTVQIFSLDPATLAQTAVTKAQDSALGRLTTGAAPGNQITRFGGDIVCLDNGNFVSVIEDRSRVFNPDGNGVVATIFGPDGSVVKDTFLVATGDIWSNVAAFKGGFAVRASGMLYFFDNAGSLAGQVDQNTSGASFDRNRGDGTRIAGHVNSPYVYLAGKVTDATLVKVAVWDARDRSFVTLGTASEGGFTGGFDRANLAVDALNRVTVTWVSQPAEYEQQQVAARVMELDTVAKTLKPLTSSFLPFVNAAKTGGIRTVGMTVATTTRQICIAAKGEINLQNQPAQGADSPREINFYTVLSHPSPAADPTPGVGGGGGAIEAAAVLNGASLNLTWSGGTGPFTVQRRSLVGSGDWTDVTTTSERSATVPLTGDTGFIRVVGQ